MVTLTYPTTGRGAWNTHGVGGTLNSDGTAAGQYFRAPAEGSHMAMAGFVGYKLVAAGAPVSVDYYAVFCAVQGIQREVGAAVDGLFGDETATRLKTWQAERRLTADGVFGPVTAEAMFRPLAVQIAKTASSSSLVARLVPAHVEVESNWDPAAVGVSTPQDLGLGQINGPSHLNLSAADRLNPRLALSSVAQIVLADAEGMHWVEGDSIAAYNLGIGGARSWVAAGRPAVWHNAPIGRYVTAVKAAEV